MKLMYTIINFSPWTRKTAVWMNYSVILLVNKIKRTILPVTSNSYLFILTGPYCGSTLLNELISTSSNVSVNNNIATREGQQVPELRKSMFEDKAQWDPAKPYPWQDIKKIWMKYWDITKPVLLEKSPPNLIRAEEINKVFQPAYFICLTRDPYAHIEGLMRRNKFSVTKATDFSLMCLRYQKKNLENLNHVLLIRYEDLVTDTTSSIEKLKLFLPQLGEIKSKKEFRSHNFQNKSMGIVNLNQDKISKISKVDFAEINKVLIHEKELLNFFNYSIIETNS